MKFDKLCDWIMALFMAATVAFFWLCNVFLAASMWRLLSEG